MMMDSDQLRVLKDVCSLHGQDKGTNEMMRGCVNKQLRIYNCSLM